MLTSQATCKALAVLSDVLASLTAK